MRTISQVNFLTEAEKKRLVEGIKDFFSGQGDVGFAYLFGSILKSDSFRDIDVAVFLHEHPLLPMKCEVGLSHDLWRFIGKPVLEFDVKILNSSPIYFQYEVIKEGEVVYSGDEKERIEYEVCVVSVYLDYKPVLDFFNRRLLREIK